MDKKITVLIADDNRDFAMTLLGYLKEEQDLEHFLNHCIIMV